MLLNEFLQKINGIQKGKFVKATWKSTKVINGVVYEKVSNGVVRLVKYANIKGVVVKGTNNGASAIIEDILYKTSNGGLLVQFATTNIKAKSTYSINGAMVDKTTYENVVGSNNGARVVFRVKLENLISLG